jgi:hypothetical protein
MNDRMETDNRHPSGGEQEPDPLDVDAAHIDARSTDAAEDIDELLEHADELGRDPDQAIDSDIPER